jgi:hypothetical protein
LPPISNMMYVNNPSNKRHCQLQSICLDCQSQISKWGSIQLRARSQDKTPAWVSKDQQDKDWAPCADVKISAGQSKQTKLATSPNFVVASMSKSQLKRVAKQIRKWQGWLTGLISSLVEGPMMVTKEEEESTHLGYPSFSPAVHVISHHVTSRPVTK